jgi:hypothetical protein
MRMLTITRDEILALLRSLQDDLTSRYKVRRIGVFGSFARKEARDDSDVDILVDFKEGADLFDLIELSQYLEEKIGRHVDLATSRTLRPEIRDGIFRDVVYA